MSLEKLGSFDSWINWAIETAAWNTLAALLYKTCGWETFAMWVM